MILKFNDTGNILQTIFETDDVYYITYNSEGYRTLVYMNNNVLSFKQKLSTLLLQFVNNKLDNFVYFVDKDLHYLININRVKRINDINQCTVVFDNDIKINIDNAYAYQALTKMVINESQDSGTVHTSSESNS